MQFKIHFDQKIESGLYEDYCRFIFEKVKEDVRKAADRRKYKVREKLVLDSSVMKWSIKLKRIDLFSLVVNCLEMVKDRDEYVIRVSSNKKVYGSKSSVSTLVRLLEYGNERIKPLPVVRTVLSYYSKRYPYLLGEFFERRLRE